MNAEQYVITYIPHTFDIWSARQPDTDTHSLLLHHDIGTRLAAVMILGYLADCHVQLATHPLYSYNLAHGNLFLPSYMKKQLKGKQLQGIENDRAFFEGIILDHLKELGLSPWLRGLKE